MPMVVLVLAGGRGERFRASGATTHKLDALLGGVPVLARVCRAAQASGLPWHLVRPPAATAGMGQSIALGVQTTAQADGWLVLPGDLPLVQPGSLQRVAQALQQYAVVVPWYQTTPGHPVGFDRSHLGALQQLQGDEGARAVVAAQRRAGRVLDLALDDPGLVTDIDTLADLQHAQALLDRP